MPSESDDPGVIRSIAVTREDVVAAVETNRTTDRTTLLRVTPPFSGRMRARLHVSVDGNEVTGAVLVDPERLLPSDVPSYPRPAETEDRLRADPDIEYTVERHRTYHEDTVDEWRDAVASSIRDSVVLQTAEGPHEVTVYVLG